MLHSQWRWWHALLLTPASQCVISALSRCGDLKISVADCLQIACYKICTVKVNRAVRDRTKQVAADAARMQEDRTSPKCETLIHTLGLTPSPGPAHLLIDVEPSCQP